MKKILKRLLNNKGLTLTELIVALFLTSVILAIAVGMLAPVKNLMNTLKSNAHMDTICATANEYIRGTLHTAGSVTFVRLNDDNSISDEAKIIAAINKGGARAIGILNTDKGYRIFDFSDVTLGNIGDLKSLISGKDADKYGAFNEPFYEGTSYAVELYNGSGNQWIQLTSQCKRDNGKKDDDGNPIIESVNQKHVLNFKLLNGMLSSGGESVTIDGSGTDEAVKIDPNEQPEIEGHGYIIVYTPFVPI